MGAGLDLHLCDPLNLVRLHVRSQPQAVLVAVTLHPGDVPIDDIEIDDERRGVDHRGTEASAVSVSPRQSNASPMSPA